jgi:FkbM family methyltransferase
MLRILAPVLSGLQSYPLRLPTGKAIHVDFRDLAVFGWLKLINGEEWQESGLVSAIVRIPRPGGVFWDIGANAGILSYEVARKSNHAEHHFFEPNPKIYEWAHEALSGIPNTFGHNFALSDTNGRGMLSIPCNRSAMGSLSPADSAHCEKFEVEKITGDTLVFERGFTPPTVMKIDTEGHELQVLAGMSRVILEYKPIIFFEHISLSDDGIKTSLPSGYRLASVSQPQGEITASFDRTVGHNSVLLPADFSGRAMT